MSIEHFNYEIRNIFKSLNKQLTVELDRMLEKSKHIYILSKELSQEELKAKHPKIKRLSNEVKKYIKYMKKEMNLINTEEIEEEDREFNTEENQRLTVDEARDINKKLDGICKYNPDEGTYLVTKESEDLNPEEEDGELSSEENEQTTENSEEDRDGELSSEENEQTTENREFTSEEDGPNYDLIIRHNGTQLHPTEPRGGLFGWLDYILGW